MQPKTIMHPMTPELDGKALSAFKDPNGLARFRAMLSAVRQEGKGAVAYQWPKPGHETPEDKIPHVQGLTPWGWIIGSAIDMDDIHGKLFHQSGANAVVLILSLLHAGSPFLGFYSVMLRPAARCKNGIA